MVDSQAALTKGFYGPYLNRFIQPDSIVPEPGNPMAYDRFAYGYNNPVKYNDPSGHCPICLHIAVEFIVQLITHDLQDGSFDTPNNIRTTVGVTKDVITTSPFSGHGVNFRWML